MAAAGPGPQYPLPEIDIEIIEPTSDDCPHSSLPPEGNVKLRNYRMLSENLRSYTPTGDIHTSPTKGKLVSKFDVTTTISPPRQRILDLLRPDDPGRDALEAIVRPAPRRGLARPLDDDTRRFLQRALLSPSPQCFSNAPTPEPYGQSPEPDRCISVSGCLRNETHEENDNEKDGYLRIDNETHERYGIEKDGYLKIDDETLERTKNGKEPDKQRSLADELAEAEEKEHLVETRRREMTWHAGDLREAFERERLGKLALSVEEDEGECEGLSAAARQLDALILESRALHVQLAGIQQDMQAACARACRCTLAARALADDSRALHYLDDLVALLRGDVAAAERARGWPFALGRRQQGRNYVV